MVTLYPEKMFTTPLHSDAVKMSGLSAYAFNQLPAKQQHQWKAKAYRAYLASKGR